MIDLFAKNTVSFKPSSPRATEASIIDTIRRYLRLCYERGERLHDGGGVIETVAEIDIAVSLGSTHALVTVSRKPAPIGP